MNRGPSLPRLLGSVTGLAIGTLGHWLTCAGRALTKA